VRHPLIYITLAISFFIPDLASRRECHEDSP